jgi:hypothetical protein
MASKKKSECNKVGDKGKKKATDLEKKITIIKQHESGKEM